MAVSRLLLMLSLAACGGFALHAQTTPLLAKSEATPGLAVPAAAPLPSAPPVHLVNDAPYHQPDHHDLLVYYVHDTYGLRGLTSTVVRSVYSQLRGRPSGWGTDLAGYGQRLGSAAAVTAINGSVRLGLGVTLHEDLRYLPCHHCSAKRKVSNALLSEITARHGEDGHRAFSLTPTIADFSGPIITHVSWYPGASSEPIEGVISARTVFATRIGIHLIREFFFDRTSKPVEAN